MIAFVNSIRLNLGAQMDFLDWVLHAVFLLFPPQRGGLSHLPTSSSDPVSISLASSIFHSNLQKETIEEAA